MINTNFFYCHWTTNRNILIRWAQYSTLIMLLFSCVGGSGHENNNDNFIFFLCKKKIWPRFGGEFNCNVARFFVLCAMCVFDTVYWNRTHHQRTQLTTFYPWLSESLFISFGPSMRFTILFWVIAASYVCLLDIQSNFGSFIPL